MPRRSPFFARTIYDSSYMIILSVPSKFKGKPMRTAIPPKTVRF